MFCESPVALISHLQRQFSLCQEIGTACRAVSIIRWFLLGGAMRWPIRHREKATEYQDGKTFQLQPSE